MEHLYMVFALLYALINGVFNVTKKKAIQKSNESVILVMFTGISFVCSLIWVPLGIEISSTMILIFALKGLLLTINWFVLLKLLSNTDVSLVSLTTVLASVITFVVGIVGFGESATIIQYIGASIVVFGAVLINFTHRQEKGKANLRLVFLLIVSAIITAGSSIIDRYTTQTLSAGQVQFWFLLFTFIFSCIFFAIDCIKNKKLLIGKSDFKNYWIYIVGIALFLGDILLFTSYTMPGSQMIIITSLSKFKVVVTVLLGTLMFREQNVVKKILISLLIFAGVLMISL